VFKRPSEEKRIGYGTLLCRTRALSMGLRADRLAVLILLLLVILSWLPRREGPIDLRWDAAVYYVLGTSLSEGKGYRLLNEPGEIEATIYPPFLPAIVAVCQRVLGTSDPVAVGRCLRGLFFVLSAAYVLAAYRLLRQVAAVPYALLGAGMCSLTFLAVWLSDRCYTDLPFALVTVLFVSRRSRANDAKHDLRSWLLATSAFLLRSIGAALLAGWVAEAVVGRRYRAAAIRLVLALLPVVAWQLYVDRVEAGPGYRHPHYAHQRADYNIYNVTYGRLFSLRDHLNPEAGHATISERVRRSVGAVPRIIEGMGGAISQPREHWEFAFDRLAAIPIVRILFPWRGITAAMTLLGLLAVWGLGVQLARGDVRLPAVTLVYLAGLCSMPHSYFGELPRYLWVLSPPLLFSVCAAMGGIVGLRRHGNRARVLVPAIVFAALAGFVVALAVFTVVRAFRTDLRTVVHRNWNGHFVTYRLFSYTDYDTFDRGLEWLNAHAARTDIVASTTPQWVYLRTGLKAVFPPFDRNSQRAQVMMDSVPVRYAVVADWLSRERILPVALHDSGSWREAYRENDFIIYERVR
jgi:hypothetical protein